MKLLPLIMSAVLVLTLSACAAEPVKDTTPKTGVNSAEQNGLSDLPDALGVDLATLISAQEMSELMGMTMEGPELLEYGTVARYKNDLGSLEMELSVDPSTREEFDTMVEEMGTDAIPLTDFGETAVFLSEYKVLYTFTDPYAVSVTFYADTVSSDNALLLARTVTQAVLDRLIVG